MEKGTINLSTANAVGAILNKKMGVTTGFAPSEWYDTINLMGKLPEKTVSGAVTHFADGADGVPMKNLVCEIPTNLEGVSSVKTTKAGKNIAIFPPDILENDNTSCGVTYHALSETTMNISGTATASSYMSNNIEHGSPKLFHLKKGTYTLSTNLQSTATGSNGVNVMGYVGTSTTRVQISGYVNYSAKRTFTLNEDADVFIQVYIPNGASIDMDIWIQLEEGSTATQYTEYIEPEVITSQLGQTVYGGNIDVVSGVLTIKYKHFVLDALTWGGGNVGGTYCWNTGSLTAEGLKIPENGSVFDGLCDNYSPIRFNGISSNVNTIAIRNTGVLYVNNGSDSELPSGKVTIALETPLTIQLSQREIQTLYGDNTIFNSAGDSSVTYRRDIELALASSTPLMMMVSRPPVTNEENITEEQLLEGDDE